MEEFLPLILGLIAIVYRIYSNFTKEQEKAKQRDISKRHDSETIPVESLPERELPEKPVYIPHPHLEEQVVTPAKPYEPVYEPYRPEKVSREMVSEPKYERMKAELNLPAEGKSAEKNIGEVRRHRALHSLHQDKVLPDEEADERSAYADLDLHDAVIKSAILNRPEY